MYLLTLQTMSNYIYIYTFMYVCTKNNNKKFVCLLTFIVFL